MAAQIRNCKVKRFALMGLLFALAMALSFLESLLPALPMLPPGIRLGLSNIVTMYALFALVGVAGASINVNSLPMVVEMCKGSDIGKFTGYYYTYSMAAQVVTPILAGTLLKHISYSMLFPYAAFFVACSFVTMCFVRHGDCKVEAKAGLAAFEDMDAD